MRLAPGLASSLIFDESLWPLLLLRITGVMTSEQFAHYREYSAALLERGEPYVCISDIRHAGMPSMAQCRQLSEWMRQHEAGMRERVLCNAIIVTSAPVRLSMSFIFHLMPPPMPHLAVAEMAPAVEFVLGKLVEARLDSAAERIRCHLFPPRLQEDGRPW